MSQNHSLPGVGVGDRAPLFNLPADGGGRIRLEDFAGRKVVLYFYPKDDTSGCTAEALDFTENKSIFEQAGAAVIGMSKDSVAKHDKFIAKHNLAVRLVSDEQGDVLNAYGVWVEKSMYGRKYMGIERASFLIDEKGMIRDIWRKVRVKGHVEAVLKAAQDL